MRKISTVCPFCDASIQAVTPKGAGSGRFLLSCSSCGKDICLTLDVREEAPDAEPSKALVKMRDVDARGKSPGTIPKRRRRKRKRVYRSSGTPGPGVIPMEVTPECAPLVMELEEKLEEVEAAEPRGRKRPGRAIPPPPDVGSDTSGEGKAGKRSSSSREGDSGFEGLKRTLSENRRKADAGAAALFFLTFLMGVLYLLSVPMYTDVTLESDSGRGGYVNIMGVVYIADENETALEGADISIEGKGLTATTGQGGHYFFSSVPEGTYTLVARKDGYRTNTARVTFSGNEADSIVNFQLTPGRGGDITKQDDTMESIQSFNSLFIIVTAASVSALTAGILTLYSKRFYPALVLGLVGIASLGYVFIGSILSFAGVLLFIYSRREF